MDEKNIPLLEIPIKMDNLLIEKVRDPKSGKMEAIIILPAKGEVKVINEVGFKVLELVNGKNTIKEIIDQIKSIYNSLSEDVEKDVISFMEILINKGIIELK
ncbi:MAG: PqqD family peptide modification chaperone [Anaerolineales bacterium]